MPSIRRAHSSEEGLEEAKHSTSGSVVFARIDGNRALVGDTVLREATCSLQEEVDPVAKVDCRLSN